MPAVAMQCAGQARSAHLLCRASGQQQQQPAAPSVSRQHVSTAQPRRRQLLAGLGAAAAAAALGGRPLPAAATGLESIDLPELAVPEMIQEMKARNQKVIDDADASFQNSDLLRTLKERTEANAAGRKKELADRYCRRQAEIGAGDCAGLRLIPGMTKSGVQKRPEWMENLLGGGSD